MTEFVPLAVGLQQFMDLRPGESLGEDEVPVEAALHNDYLVGVLQLRRDDVPELGFFPGSDLFQLLWCPRSHPDQYAPYCEVRWRSVAAVANPLSSAPLPSQPDPEAVPAVCVLSPERVVEYPFSWGLSDELIDRIEAWTESPAAKGHSYFYELSVAPGTKVGGYIASSYMAEPPPCAECGAQAEHLLTVASGEGGAREAMGRWEPEGESPAPNSTIELNGLADLTFFICRRCQDWPISWVLQAG